ncbi:ubiquitin-like autophagy protein apg12 domain-containing protein [Hirsutella rhossiliensis]|uniref:Ubiquitin-like protein ATG12 n=1 Tax=Hirsutella rhossiliensis TaxID=111463 RepID=A0A9P8SDJ7_9HYPO|nr:ubiquitin-like autophagy protein apg12 domain-containing protein [Hirsutella rhossiliensis]KAH0958666.1 ubiquitin-like autophagy protein apg12 domain-containing protein [Hirsutella rhossiliensis]
MDSRSNQQRKHPPPASPLPSHRSPASPAPAADDDDGGDGDSENDNGGDDTPELPLTMSASVVLADLPRDAAAALASVAAFGPLDKVVVRFKPVGAAPALAQDLCKITATRRFEEVVRYLRRKLRCGDTDSVFLYVNSAFAPSLDEVVGNLHQCFKNAQDQLVVAYSITPAFG